MPSQFATFALHHVLRRLSLALVEGLNSRYICLTSHVNMD